MPQDNQSDNPQEAKLAKLETQLREAAVALKFFEQDTGRLWTQFVTEEINAAIKDITSDKYEKDHTGYIKRLADLQAYKKILRKMQVACSPQRTQKLRTSIEEIENG